MEMQILSARAVRGLDEDVEPLFNLGLSSQYENIKLSRIGVTLLPKWMLGELDVLKVEV